LVTHRLLHGLSSVARRATELAKRGLFRKDGITVSERVFHRCCLFSLLRAGTQQIS
jgi:hypothetical protein